MAMKSKVLILMALVLAVATAATTMTAFAEPEKKKKNQISEQVADSIQTTSQAILRLKVRQVRRVPDNYQPPSITLAKPKLN